MCLARLLIKRPVGNLPTPQYALNKGFMQARFFAISPDPMESGGRSITPRHVAMLQEDLTYL